MPSLALKIPPPVVAACVAVAMWLLSHVAPTLFSTSDLARIGMAVAIALLGGAISLAGILEFRRARTTVNPLKPHRASALVVSGIYKLTRNPMYVGLLLVLVAWAVFLSATWPFVGPVVFVAYIGRFQIAPEEKVMAEKFGAEYAAYKLRVRKWL